ncbi:MAG: pyridoxal-phosphate dependent enzyme [Bacteroidetes bacterium]|nr:pyridoxal-phosphate dependent enzyme [Bacteroidota bacterium]
MTDSTHGGNTIPTATDISAAHDRIRGMVHRTPVLSSALVNRELGCEVFFKCENFQKGGAFKFRGASNAMLSLDKELLKRGVATHSSGNHAQALAKAAQMLGVPAYIVMPSSSPDVKVAGVKTYGGQITFCEPTLAARESTLEKVVCETGAVFIHPYNRYDIIAGQATAAKELLEEIAAPDFMLAPVGGGGLMSGTALSTHYFSPTTRIFGTEPLNANDAWKSMKAGRLIPSENPKTLCDGLLTSLSEKTFEILSKHLEDILTPSEESIISAMQLVWERMKIIIEPSSAVPVAAILENRNLFAGQLVGVIISGGNVDLQRLPFAELYI